MNKPGFTLIELLVATFIASIMGALLFSALYQVNKAVPRVDSVTDIYEKAALLNAQFERDLSGVTAPAEFYYRQPEPEKKKNKQNEPAQSDTQKKASAADDKAQEKKPKKPLEKIFFGTTKGGNFDQLSFITTNPLQGYWDSKSGSAKPRIARVQYILKEEKETPKSYSLIRKESPNLEFDALQKTGKEGAHEYTIAQGIKNLSAEYTYYVPEKSVPESQSGQSAAQVPPPKTEAKPAKKCEIKKMGEWVRKEGSPGKTSEQDQLPLAPQQVEFKVDLWDSLKKRSTPFIFKIYIRSDIPETREEGDVTQKLLGTLRDFFSQNTKQPATPVRITQGPRPSMQRGNFYR